ncbi:MAG: YegS/Rv2252/BmrU family lipid kinase [Clostridia bacterium]|nr:YegS/Rv2252/BmrU family lipid kinase [Clostridia bacterium]
MKKRLLLVMNPMSGLKRANRFLTDILILFCSYGWDCRTYLTGGKGDGRKKVTECAAECDLVVCIGGDGTFNECVDGLLACGANTPLGYIPAGSTNDFATSLKLSKNIMKAARDIMEGSVRNLDVGSFDGRHFTYVASFGAFTKASYATPQNVKNSLGHLAYVLEGINDISAIRPWHLRFETPEKTVEGDYIFGAVSNSTSVAGLLTISPKIVDMNDGRFELLLIRHPTNIVDLSEIIRALSSSDYSSYMLDFFSASEIRVSASENMDWTLDGEWQKGASSVKIENIHNAIRVVTNPNPQQTAQRPAIR